MREDRTYFFWTFKFSIFFTLIFETVQLSVLGPRLILSVREYHAKFVTDSDAASAMNSISFQERVNVRTSSSVQCRTFSIWFLCDVQVVCRGIYFVHSESSPQLLKLSKPSAQVLHDGLTQLIEGPHSAGTTFWLGTGT